MSKREIIAFALAPAPVVAPILIITAIILTSLPKDWAGFTIAMLQLVLLSYAVTLTIGLPIHLLLRRKKRTGLAAYTGLTAITVISLAGAFALLDWALLNRANDNPFALHMWSGFGFRLTLLVAALASLSAAIFWSVAVSAPRSRPSVKGR